MWNYFNNSVILCAFLNLRLACGYVSSKAGVNLILSSTRERAFVLCSNETPDIDKTFVSSRVVLKSTFGLFFGAITLFTSARKTRAIGNIFELAKQSMVIQDIGINVIETSSEQRLFERTFDGTCKNILSVERDGLNTSVLSFGPVSYISPKDFVPGISHSILHTPCFTKIFSYVCE